MSHIRIDSSVPRHRKFVQAGPAPSWLWVCGLAYCQEGLTDGFIPNEAIDYLGVKNARRLALHLVKAGLWETAPGGWQVHDYLKHNRSSAQVNAIKEERREAGRAGGRARGEAISKQSAKQDAKQSAKHTSKPYVDVVGSVADVDAEVVEGGPEGDFPMDVWTREFLDLYPAQGTCAAALVEPHLYAVLTADPRVSPLLAWTALKMRLDGHIRSHQWRVKGMIPRADRYLRDGTHQQILPEIPVSERLSEKTARTLASAAAFVREGERGA